MSGLTIDNPVTLSGALSSGIIPGDTLMLRTGVYASNYVFSLQGTAENPITIQAYPGERAILNGLFTCSGRHLIFKNLEITYLGWDSRIEVESGSNPTNMLNKQAAIYGVNVKFINCVFHDLSILGWWIDSTNSEFYGCLMYNIGWVGSDRAHGHALYTQNALDAVTRKTVKHCAMFNCFGYNLHVYGSDGAMSHYTITENTCFNGGILYDGETTPWYGVMIGAGQAATDNVLVGNMTYNNERGFHSFGEGGDHYQATDNYFPDGWYVGTVQFDVNSGNYVGSAVGNQVFLCGNDYDANRANLTIYNEAASNTIDVDVSAVFGQTGTVKAYNVQDYFVDVQILTITAGVITVSMQADNRTVATPIGWTAPAKTFPQFGCFVLIKQ